MVYVRRNLSEIRPRASSWGEACQSTHADTVSCSYSETVSIQSIDRAFMVLRLLAQGPAGVTYVSEQSDLPKSTAARILAALVEAEAVTQDPNTALYRIGPLVGELAEAVLPGSSLTATARPHLTHLSEVVGESAGIAIRDGAHCLHLDEVAPESDIMMRDWTGELHALHTVPAGLIMLAYSRIDDVARYLREPLEAYTERTMTDPEQLNERFRRIRNQTHEWVYGEFADDINSVAAPVRDHTGRVVAALLVHGPAYRFPDDRSEFVEQALVESANRLSEML